MGLRKTVVLAILLVAGATVLIFAWRAFSIPHALLKTLETADRATACEMARGTGMQALQSSKTGRCVDLDQNSLRGMAILLHRRILMDPIKRHTEGICSDFVTPDTELTVSGKSGVLTIQLNDDRCWMSLSDASGSMMISDPEMVKRMPSFQTAVKRTAPNNLRIERTAATRNAVAGAPRGHVKFPGVNSGAWAARFTRKQAATT